MNKYPLWKYFIIIAVIVASTLYAIPNLYPTQPALQVNTTGERSFTGQEFELLKAPFEKADVKVLKQGEENGKLIMRFADTDSQFRAKEVVRKTLGDKYAVSLNLLPTTPKWLSDIGGLPMYLGLDLRGGVHFLMQVDVDSALTRSFENYRNDFRTLFRKEKLRYLGVKRKGSTIRADFRDDETRTLAMRVIQKEYTGALMLTTEDDGKVYSLVAEVDPQTVREIKRNALKQNITVLRNRVNELGVAEPIIQQQGLDRIIVQLPGIQDPEVAKQVLGTTATLEFRMVAEDEDAFSAHSAGVAPVGTKLFYTRSDEPVLLKNSLILTGESVTDAAATFDQSQRPAVKVTLDSKGAKRFSEVTGRNVGKLMAVVFIEHKFKVNRNEKGEIEKHKTVTQEVINQATIQDQLGKIFEITGLDSTDESRKLALLLRAGALAAPVYIVEERTIGPSLGEDNIAAGFQSVIFGFVLVLIFMLVYYRLFGLFANIALTLNLVIIIAVLSMLQATLTLPGIAGIVLTVGMAVDANVLIFERIREELKGGSKPQQALHAGYEKAASTIFDANITTFIAAAILFAMGTGSIKGFAITLAIGILSSMFTAIMVTRGLANLAYGGRKVEKLFI